MRGIVLVASALAATLTAADTVVLWKQNARARALEAATPPTAAADPGISEETRARVEALRAEAAHLRLLMSRLVSPEIWTTDRLQEEVAAHLDERDRGALVARMREAAEGIGARVKAIQIDMNDYLALDSGQQTRIRAILEQFATDFSAAALVATVDQPVEVNMEKLFADADARIKAELREEQVKRYRTLPRGLMMARRPRRR